MNKLNARAAAIALACVILFAGAAHAAQEPALDCSSDMLNQHELNQCAHMGYQEADKELNAAYKKLMAMIGSDADAKKALIAAERAWIAFRDAECAHQASGLQGGSMQPMIVSYCLASMTRQRTMTLKKQYSMNMEGDPTEYSMDTLMPIETAARSYSIRLADENPDREYDVIGGGFPCEVYASGVGEIVTADCERQVAEIMAGERFASVWTTLHPLDCDGCHVRDAAPGAVFLLMREGGEWTGLAWALTPEDAIVDAALVKKYGMTEDEIGPVGWGAAQ